LDVDNNDANKKIIVVQKKLNPTVCYAKINVSLEKGDIIRVYFPDDMIKNAAQNLFEEAAKQTDVPKT